ncbi:hypothetical protein BH11ACT5_BH11ACT5_17060 [soil metagenome]
MGIRYLAFPLPAGHLDEARENPRCYLSSDLRDDAFDDDDGDSRALDLDKGWRDLQALFALPRHSGNPAKALVAGNVTHTARGWRPFYGVLSPAELEEVALGLAEIDPEDIRSAVDEMNSYRDAEEEFTILTYFMRTAQTFTASLAHDGFGLIYIIG